MSALTLPGVSPRWQDRELLKWFYLLQTQRFESKMATFFLSNC
jgi:hypothetical protein